METMANQANTIGLKNTTKVVGSPSSDCILRISADSHGNRYGVRPCNDARRARLDWQRKQNAETWRKDFEF